MDTSHGKITIELFADKAPITVKNFLAVRGRQALRRHHLPPRHRRLHDPGRRHGAGPQARRRPRDPIKNEADNGLSNERGTIAMARTNDPDSATAQFFINVKDNHVPRPRQGQDRVGYAVFGKVIDGMDVVDKIRRVETDVARRPRRRAASRTSSFAPCGK